MPDIERRPNPFSSENAPETQKIVRDAEEARQKVKDRLDPYKSEIVVQIDPKKDLPLRIVHVGDTHLGHDDATIGALDKAIAEVGDGIMVTQGNIIEGISSKFIRNNTTRTGFNLNEQEMIAKDKLKPVDEKGKLIAVGMNDCHEGWAMKTATHDPLPSIVGETTPMLYTGGQIIFKQGEKKMAVVEVYHNAGEGRTKQSPEGSARARSREVPVGHPLRPDAVVNAHMHNLDGGQDVIHNPIERRDVVTNVGEVGAAKGTKERPDEFLIGRGVPPRNQPADAGEGFVHILKRKGIYPVVGYERADLLYAAETLWENAQRTGNFEEFREMVLEVEKKNIPTKKLLEEESEIRKREQILKAEGKAPLYKVLSYDIRTKLPIRIQFIGNLRVGSSSLEQGRVISILDKAEANPWAFVFATRRLLNPDTAKQVNRQEILERLAKLLAHGKDSLLGVMLTDEFRSHSWARTIKEITYTEKKNGDKGKRVRRSYPEYPGDWLYYESAIKGTPLALQENVSFLKVGDVKYTLYQRDKLSHFTSLLNLAHGLKRVQEVFGVLADAYVGGHTEMVGWRTWMQPWGQMEIVVPGGFSEYIEKGVGSRVDYPEGGQGVIFFPKKKTVFSFATHQDGVDMHDALWLQEGLRNMKKLDEISEKLQKSRK